MKLAATAVAAAVVAAAHVSALPPPSFRVAGYPLALAAAGPRATVSTSSCLIRVADLAARGRAVAVRPPERCRTDAGEAGVDGVWIGRSALAAMTIEAPSPHGESYTLSTGPLPRGPLRQRGGDWGWTDSDVPAGFGCAWSVAAGGGVIALAQVPNRLAVDQGLEEKPACPAGAASKIILIGGASPGLMVPGSWSILATDGKRLLLARLDAEGAQTGELALVDVHGKRLATPAVAPAVARAAVGGWLTPEGLVLDTTRGIRGPGWTVRGVIEATVAEGRLLYLKGRTIRVRRVRGGPDRALMRVPTEQALLAAGSFGLAVATGTETSTTVYRVPWRTIDRTLARR